MSASVIRHHKNAADHASLIRPTHRHQYRLGKRNHTMNKLAQLTTAAALALALIAPAFAAETISGEVKKVDAAAGKVTLKHGAAKSLGMTDPMTMVYGVKDPAMLGAVKVGDKVKFEAVEDSSGYTVTKIEKSK
jgi:Cu/Ag efflux protein CusF